MFMGTYTRFVEMPLWNEAVDFAADIYRFCETSTLRTDYRMKDQLRAAASSVSNNIAEGFERGGNTEFIQFLYIAKSSCGEVRSHFVVALDQHYITEADYKEGRDKAAGRD